jgi:hypothetical protein
MSTLIIHCCCGCLLRSACGGAGRVTLVVFLLLCCVGRAALLRTVSVSAVVHSMLCSCFDGRTMMEC